MTRPRQRLWNGRVQRWCDGCESYQDLTDWVEGVSKARIYHTPECKHIVHERRRLKGWARFEAWRKKQQESIE